MRPGLSSGGTHDLGYSWLAGPVYLAEMAPAKLRGTLNVIFQLFVSASLPPVYYPPVLRRSSDSNLWTRMAACRSPSEFWQLASSTMAASSFTPGKPLCCSGSSTLCTAACLVVRGLITGRRFCGCRGWRLPLALAGAPGLWILFAGLVLPDSPNSLAERGRYDEALKAYLSNDSLDSPLLAFS